MSIGFIGSRYFVLGDGISGRSAICLLDEVCLIEALIFFTLIKVLLDDIDLAEAIDFKFLKIFKLHVDEFKYLALHIFLVICTNELTIA